MSLQRAREQLARVGVAVEGQAGRAKLMRAAYSGHDWGIPVAAWIDVLASWNAKNQPPWPMGKLAREVESFYRSAREPFGHKTGATRGARTPVEAPPKYPPIDEVRAVWRAGVPVDAPTVADVAGRWLADIRGYDVSGLAQLERAGLERKVPVLRALAADAQTGAGWAENWPREFYRVLLPLFDAGGAVRSLRARLCAGRETGAPKAISPAGFNVRGLVMMNPQAVEAIRNPGMAAQLESWWLFEGETDYLRAVSDWQGKPRAIVGLLGGAMPDGLASAIPSGARVVSMMDHDEAGERYHRRLRELMPHVERWKI
jgi:hypothetical protein